MKSLLTGILLVTLLGCVTTSEAPQKGSPKRSDNLELGNFSVSLAVKDLAASRAFYEKLGFAPVGGKPAQGWLVLQNKTSTIGLFQGMFKKNLMTFNPGWTRDKLVIKGFTDIRVIQRRLRARGIKFQVMADENTTGPAHFTITDPDGNQILVDQHVSAPK